MRSKIKTMLELQEEPIFREDFLEIKLKQKGNFQFKDFALCLLQDCQDGVFREYDNPVLKTDLDCILMKYYERTFVLGEILLKKGYSNELVEELREYVKTGAFSISHFRIGDNWKGKYDFDIIGFFHKDMKENYPRILLNKNSKTHHLQPFLDGRIVDNKLYLNHNGKRIEEKL